MSDLEMTLPTESAAEFYSAYAKAQAAMGAVLKNASNPAFKSKYADLAGVLEAVLPALNNNGLAFIQVPAFDGETASITTVIAHTSGAALTSTLRLRPTKADPQGVGSAHTYARRYAALALCGVAPEDDDGNAASQPGNGASPARFASAKQEQAPPPTLAQRADSMIAALQKATTQAELDATRRRAKGLLAELDASDPERLAEVDAAFEAKANDLAAAPIREAA